jgi:hypothetical protein
MTLASFNPLEQRIPKRTRAQYDSWAKHSQFFVFCWFSCIHLAEELSRLKPLGTGVTDTSD